VDSDVRVVEYSVTTPEQRRTLTQALSEEASGGATVLGMVPVSLRQEEEGDLVVTRLAVYYLGGDDMPGGGEAEAVAAVADEGTAPSLVEDIMAIPSPDADSEH
jgi:hypothetical protein